MKMRRGFFLSFFTGLTIGIFAANSTTNSTEAISNNYYTTNDISLDEVVISSTRVAQETPVTQSFIDKELLNKESIGARELPFIMQSTPSVVATSDNGLGIGTAYIRIRGSNDTRINFTLDGVPLNSSEDQSVFWANMNSYSGSLESIQIQRGVGSSTNGGGAFGATVNMRSSTPETARNIELEGSMGSYNTYQGTIKLSSGLLFNHLALDGRFSKTHTDGYIDRTNANLGSYFTSATWYGNNFMVRFKNFGSFERTEQAWNGVPSDSIKQGNRTYNNLGLHKDSLGTIRFQPTTDNYWQNHSHLSFVKKIDCGIEAQATLHYTYGNGYYEDMKGNYDLAKKFGLNQYSGIKANANRRKWLDNNFVGGIFNINKHNDNLKLTLGGGLQYFDGDHWGNFESIEGVDIGNYRYYESDAKKIDGNIFLKATFNITENINVFADVQYRGARYVIEGNNDKFIKDSNGDYQNQILDIDERFNFFNPKAGISYVKDYMNAYISFARTSKEPTRNNYTDNGSTLMPKAETLNDIEAGYKHMGNGWFAGFNLYLMDYKDQLIATGQISHIGEALTDNVEKSYRAGIELEGGFLVRRLFSWNGNATLSRNRIINFTEYIDNWDGNPITKFYDQTDIALSPNFTAASTASFNLPCNMNISLVSNFVGRQYLDNSSNKSRSLDPYSVSDLILSYSFTPKKIEMAKLSLKVRNLFNKKYSSNGWVYSAVSESLGYDIDNRYSEDGLFVQAPINFLCTFTLKL